ncbi:ATP-binding cassette domain-containing protein [Alteromonas pelagimontana]|uniref:ATP-binding cassette domain-containing protein n=1 Tax=Alteromonas pelagimontana TaxID=1858656 RepID=A0A6M4MI87_9ALTE|nr:ATP-binding cassette domain-containing protein [Alteromonas pelagimontana]QJR82345.1 ATP-binding cassette domain-containing protein [Alteromonas pelagimontana]
MEFAVKILRPPHKIADNQITTHHTTQLLGLTGPSGAGKTTLLRCLAKLEANATVTGKWGDANLQQARVGMVFQQPALFPHLSVGQNLAFAADLACSPGFAIDDVSEGCSCSHLVNKMPAQISGGEAQRVAIARAILNSPDILLLDEPVSAMDQALKRKTLAYLRQLATDGLPMILVSHDLRDLTLFCDALLYMENGKIMQVGEPSQVLEGVINNNQMSEQWFSLLSGSVVQHHANYSCYEIECEDQKIYARHPVIDSGVAKITIDAREVSLDRQHRSESSIVNAFECEIGDINTLPDGQVLVRLERQQTTLYSLISQLSLEKMALERGETVTARFKMR